MKQNHANFTVILQLSKMLCTSPLLSMYGKIFFYYCQNISCQFKHLQFSCLLTKVCLAAVFSSSVKLQKTWIIVYHTLTQRIGMYTINSPCLQHSVNPKRVFFLLSIPCNFSFVYSKSASVVYLFKSDYYNQALFFLYFLAFLCLEKV